MKKTEALLKVCLSFLAILALTSTFFMPLPAFAKSELSPLSGVMTGENWLKALPTIKLAYCEKAFSAFRASPSQSYIISSNVQSLTPSGLCDRMDQYYSLDENLDSRLGTAAAIAPLLFADTPIGTSYKNIEAK